MKQMICLMSEQLIPSYLAVKYHKPDRIWRILSEDTLQEGRDQIFCETLKAYAGFPLDLPDCGHLIAEPTNFESTRLLVKKLIEQEPQDDWIINVTGGNKMIAAGAILAAVVADRPLNYTELRNPGQLLDARRGKAKPFGPGLKVLEFLSLYGFTATPDTAHWSRPWLDLAGRFAANPPEENPFRLTQQQVREAERSGLMDYTNKFVRSFSAELRDALNATVRGANLTRRQYLFVAGKWIEVFLFDLIKGLRQALDINDIQPGVRVTHAGVENEFDIALTRGLDFVYIECKPGAQMRHKPGNQIEEILGTLNRLGALRAKALIATTGENFLDKSSGRLRVAVEKRMREAGMNVLIRHDIVELAARRDDAGFIVPRLTSFLSGTA